MIVTLDRRPTPVRHAVDLEPLLGVDLVRAEDGSDLVVEDLCGRARQGAKAGVAKPYQVLLERLAEPASPFAHLESGKGVDVYVLGAGADRL